MTDDPGLVPAGESRRLAALQRLAVRVEGSDPALDASLELVGGPLAAEAVSVTMVDADTASTLASTTRDAPLAIPRSRSVAAAAIDADDIVCRVFDSADADADPWSGRLGRPITCVAVPLRARGGEAVGALEVVRAGVRDLAPSDRVTLERSAAHVSDVLELRAEVSEYRRFVELSPDALIVLDLDGTIVLSNPALAALIGRSGEDPFVGRAFLELVGRHDRARVTAELARVLFARDRTVQLDLDLVTDGGRIVPCSVSAGHLGGPRRHLQLVVHDLSDRLREEEERTRLSEQLARAQRLDAVGRIAGGLAHDLNNLLVIMVSNLGLAEESLATAVEVAPDAPLDSIEEDLGELRVAVDRANGLTTKLLQFARQETSSGGTCDVGEVAHAVEEFIGRSLGPEVTLCLEIDPDLPPIAADPVQLERVLVNLVINAREALEGRGRIAIRAGFGGSIDREGPDRGPTGDGLHREHAAVRIQVSDDGIGMDDATQARAFEPLFTTRSGEGGTGLGLATVLSFADEADGVVALESAPGRGTTISLSLPAAERPVDDLPFGADVPVAGARVVLVDPGERTRRVISRMLRGAGYRVQAFSTGEDALRAVHEDGANLIVTEVSLPGMSGARLLTSAQEADPDLRAIALTAIDGPSTLRGVPVLVKPFSHARLLRTVEQVLRDA